MDEVGVHVEVIALWGTKEKPSAYECEESLKFSRRIVRPTRTLI